MCVLGAGSSVVEFPEINEGFCCYGAMLNGPQGCTCWRPVFDLEQAELVPGLPQIPIPVRMCEAGGPGAGEGCAYRPHSPERDGAGDYQGTAEHLECLAATGQPFFCHKGIRRAVAWQHPEAGIEVPGHLADYQPPIISNVPYRADGQPAYICAGWLLRAAALRRRGEAAA